MKSWKKPTPENVERAVSLLVYVEQYRYFFDRLDNPEWLEPLWRRGFFKHPPQPEYNEEEGTVRFPSWPEGRYLARMAQHKPNLVAEIIKKIDDVDNAAVLSDLVNALRCLPCDISAQLTDRVMRWAEVPYLLMPEEVGQFVSHLAKGGRTKEAMAIAGVLLDVLPDAGRQRVAERDGPNYAKPKVKPRARFETWRYEQIIRKYYPDLVREAGLPALVLLCDLLEKAIQLSQQHADDRGPEDYSYIWRTAIEADPQHRDHTINDALVSGVRDAAELVVRFSKAPLEEVITSLERRRWKVFRRVAFHVLRVFPKEAEVFAADRLTNRSLFDDLSLRHEYVLLLREFFPRLTHADQTRILGWVDDGPEGNEWGQVRESEMDQQEEEVARYRAIWQRDWLARIGSGNLPRRWQEYYRELVEKYGEPEHPEFPAYTEVRWVGPASPKTAEDLKAMSVEEIVEYLKTWRPPGDVFHEVSPEGLGRVLTDVVSDDPNRFVSEALRFRGLDPTYVRAVVSGVEKAAKHGRAIEWKPVLELCDWVLSQPREIDGQRAREMDADPDWVWTRREIAGLLSTGFEKKDSRIPVDFRQGVWGILRLLTDDPDPTPQYEQRYGGSNMDPATLSINTTRGKAMHAVVRYALWVRSHLEKEPDAHERFAKGLDEMPEVREVLDAHLDQKREKSRAIRSVYGQWFPWLLLLDARWARKNAVRIFPHGEHEQEYFGAAWNTYVTFCRPYDNVLDILRDQYRHAVQRIGSHEGGVRLIADPDERLSEHIMTFYWRGKLELSDPLLSAFWEKAPDALRAHALSFVGGGLQQTSGPIPNEILDRLIRLWEARISAAKESPANHKLEMAAVGWWFISGKFDTEWTVAQLAGALQISGIAMPGHVVVEKLSEIVEDYPGEALDCLKMIIEGDREGWGIYIWRKHARNILAVALRDVRAKQKAEDLIHYLGRRGYLEFRDLLHK